MTREQRLELLKQIEKDIHVCSLESTLLDDAKSCAIHSAIEELEQEPILDKVKQARKEIKNEVKFWSDSSKYNEESLAYVRKAKARSYKHCLEILDKLIESEEV